MKIRDWKTEWNCFLARSLATSLCQQGLRAKVKRHLQTVKASRSILDATNFMPTAAAAAAAAVSNLGCAVRLKKLQLLNGNTAFLKTVLLYTRTLFLYISNWNKIWLFHEINLAFSNDLWTLFGGLILKAAKESWVKKKPFVRVWK